MSDITELLYRIKENINAVENGEFAPFESAVRIAKNVAYNNIKNKLSE